MKLVDTKHDTQTVDSGLWRVFSAHEAQKFQAIESDLGVNHPPKHPNSFAIDRVNHTVTVSFAKDTICILPEPVLGEPPVETRPEQSDKHPGGRVLGNFIEIPDPIPDTNRALPTPHIVVVLQMLGKARGNTPSQHDGIALRTPEVPVRADGFVS